MGKLTRREYIGAAGGLVVGAAAAGAATYWLTRPPPEKEPIIIGMAVDQTGFLAAYGYWLNKGAVGAAKYINEMEGGVDGRPLELVFEDTASDVAVATKKIRKIVNDAGAVAIIPTPMGSIGLAAAPIVKNELKVPYLYHGATYYVTLEGNRWTFQMHVSLKTTVGAFVDILPRMGEKFAIPYIDYAWGWSYRDEWHLLIDKVGGEVISEFPIPVGTTDFYPYMAKIPKESDAILFSIVGLSECMGAVKALREIGYEQPILGALGSMQGGDLSVLLPYFEGCYFQNSWPQYTAFKDTANIRTFREWCGITEYGADEGNPANTDIDTSWGGWHYVHVLAEAIRETGWTNREDNPELCKYIEGRTFKESVQCPAGDCFIRAEDHHAFRTAFIHKVENGELKLDSTVPPDKLLFPPEVDRTKEGF